MIPLAARWKAYVDNRAYDRRNVDIYIYRELDEGAVQALYFDSVDDRGNLTLKTETIQVGLGMKDVRPSIRLPRDVAAVLVDSLSNYGIKPTDAGKLAGLYEAQGKHLADLQAFIGHILGIQPIVTLQEEGQRAAD